MQKQLRVGRTDPLSDALSAMHMDSGVLGLFEFSAPWAIVHPSLKGVLCHIVAEGQCFCTSTDGPAITLRKGDFIAFPHGDPHTLGAEPGKEGTPVSTLLNSIGHALWRPQSQYPTPVHYRSGGGGDRAIVIDLVSEFPDPQRNPLLRALPRMIHIPAEKLKVLGWLDLFLEIIASEDSTPKPGYAAAISRLADLIFIQAVRVHLETDASETRGMLRGLLHPQISRALQAMHNSPNQNWTVASLAKEAGMSRTHFAVKFLACVGKTPIHYLTQWRMHLAVRRLTLGMTVATVSDQLGYASPISFARTFKRVIGRNPSSCRPE
jgi:AraC-like DNA-binding protein